MIGPVWLIVHVAATWFLVGLIWTVQLVQYPGFRRVGEAELAAYHAHHCSRIAWIVAPAMGLELVTGIGLALDPPADVPTWLVHAGLALIAVIWTATAFVSVPLHSRLSARNGAAIGALVATNWIRTLAWTARGVGVLFVLDITR